MDYSEKRVFITGWNGFLGRYLYQHLITQGAEVFGLSRRKQPTDNYNINSEINVIRGDILNRKDLDEALQVSEPEIIIHLAAQSHVGASFSDPVKTCEINCTGTTTLLESVRDSTFDPLVIFPGSADEYGLVFSSEQQYERILNEKRNVFPKPAKIPELPVSELNPLRPVSPYGVSKVFGDYLTRSFHHSYSMKTIVIRSFNIEGRGRGEQFATASIAKQVAEFKRGDISSIHLGDVVTFRDFTHISDAIAGYCRIMEKGELGEVYNLGSMRATSVLSYLLIAIESAGYSIHNLSTFNGNFYLENPLSAKKMALYGIIGDYSLIDTIIATNGPLFTLQSGGIKVSTNKGDIPVFFDQERFRPSDNPFIVADIQKIKEIGYKPQKSIQDIAIDQVTLYE